MSDVQYGRHVLSADYVRRSVLPRVAKWTYRTEAGCLEWTGLVNDDGYAIMCVQTAAGQATVLVHRLLAIIEQGHEAYDGLLTDHTCRNRRCVDVEHLEPVTDQENVRRGDGHSEVTRAKTSAALKGHTVGAVTRQAISSKMMGNVNALGHKRSPETVDKLRPHLSKANEQRARAAREKRDASL